MCFSKNAVCAASGLGAVVTAPNIAVGATLSAARRSRAVEKLMSEMEQREPSRLGRISRDCPVGEFEKASSS
jgi:hypothetical protein